MLLVMCGLPGAGKSTLADDLGRRLGWPVLSVDPVDAAIREAGVDPAQPTGLAAYNVVEAVADRLLRLGLSVVVDAVNDVPEARGQWTGLAARREVELGWVEVRCSDPVLHRRRLESRRRDLPGFPEPTWDSLPPRRAALAAWTEPRLVVDSADDRAANLALVLNLTGRA